MSVSVSTPALKLISHKDLVTQRYLLKFSYIGTSYTGIQRTTARGDEALRADRSVQYQIEKAIQRQLLPIYGARLALSSRTDSGVHALVNSAHIDLVHPYANTVYKASFITNAVNDYLRSNEQEIRILSTRAVPDGFNSRNAAKWRTYLYRLAVIESEVDKYVSPDSLLPINELNRCHVISGQPNIEKMCRVIDLFKGEHDFASFTPRPEKNDRHIVRDSNKVITDFQFRQMPNYFDSEFVDKSDHKISLLCFEVTSKSFLYNQIRRMIGCLIDVAFNRMSTDRVQYLLESPSHLNWRTGQTVAPAKGLWLKYIHYEEEDMKLFDESGLRVYNTANSYPDYKDISLFVQ